MYDKQSACIRCATGAALHSMGLRTKALGFCNSPAKPEPKLITAEEYTDALVRAVTHGNYNSLFDWSDAIEDTSEPETIYRIWIGCIQHAEETLPEEVLTAYNGTEGHVRLIEITGEVTGTYPAVDAYFQGVPALDIIA